LRHYRFMLEGLADVRAALEARGIRFVARRGEPAEVALALARDAVIVVCDRGYTRHQKAWRSAVAQDAHCPVVQVEADVVVPVEIASSKAEVAARTIRPKLTKHWPTYLVPLRRTRVARKSLALEFDGLDLDDIHGVLEELDIDRSVAPNPLFRGGTCAALRALARFLDDAFVGYDDHRNQPHTSYVSHMSKYLHFGQISPVDIALRIMGAVEPSRDRSAFLEELLVRRELAQNFVHYTPNYDAYDALPAWARATLAAHAGDPRAHVYSKEQLVGAQTHDPYWNAAMRELRYTGYMHNHMRMYWGKKILEWSATPEAAHAVALELNNTFFVDGRDPNSFANVSWIFGLHDRPWPERPIFGKVRYMAASGLERKGNPALYVRRVDALVREVQSAAART
jgi:deoxyribodipyrimidine photo-lyase